MVGTNPYHVVAVRRRSGRPPRSPTARFIDFGRLYPGGGKQWSAPTPTMLWRCPVGPVGARSVRAVRCLSRVQSARACCCVVCARCCDTSACVRAAVPCARAAASAARACCCVVRACCCVCSACVLLLRRQCAVCPCVRAADSVAPPPVLSNSDVYTPGVGNNGRHQPLPCRGTAPSVRPAATDA